MLKQHLMTVLGYMSFPSEVTRYPESPFYSSKVHKLDIANIKRLVEHEIYTDKPSGVYLYSVLHLSLRIYGVHLHGHEVHHCNAT